MQAIPHNSYRALLVTLLAITPSLPVVSTAATASSLILGTQLSAPTAFALGSRQAPAPIVLAALEEGKGGPTPMARKKRLAKPSVKKKSWRERDRESLAALKKSLSDNKRLRWTDRGGHNRIIETELTADELANLLIYDEQLRAAEPGKLSHDADWLDLPEPLYGPLTSVVDPIETLAAPRVKQQKKRLSGPAVKVNNAPPLSARSIIDPWHVPIGADLRKSQSLGAAMQSLLSLVGFRLVTEGSGVDRRSLTALSMPVPKALQDIRANNLRDALVALAGPGLTVVVDHAQRAVAVDVNPGHAPLLTASSN